MPREVLTSTEQSRLADARNSDKTMMIIKPEEVGQDANATGEKTWHFKMLNTRDVAWAASKALYLGRCTGEFAVGT